MGSLPQAPGAAHSLTDEQELVGLPVDPAAQDGSLTCGGAAPHPPL